MNNNTKASRLLSWLKEFWSFRRREVDEQWNRTLPFGDYVVDRWEKAQALGFGEGTSVYDSVLVFGEVQVGNQTWIGPFVILDGSGGLKIGSNCCISAGCQIYTHDTVEATRTGGRAQRDEAPTRIGDRCYLGPNTVVAKGVTIGEGCVIGANSFVNKDLPPNCKAFGTPCRVVDHLGDADVGG